MITCPLYADYLILLRLVEIQCFLSQFCVVAKVVIIKEKISKIWLYTRHVRFSKKKDPSMFLAPYLNISLKSKDLEKNSSKSNEELTNRRKYYFLWHDNSTVISEFGPCVP
jgi:hypothetical protein